MTNRRVSLFLIAGIILFAAGIILFLKISTVPMRPILPSEIPYDDLRSATPPSVAEATGSPEASLIPRSSPGPSRGEDAPKTSLPDALNLKIPFTPQAPHANWEAPYKEFCEEASALMTAAYLTGKDIPNAEYADAELRRIESFELDRFGYYEDTSASETAIILQEHFGISSVALMRNPTIDDMKRALAEGKAIIMPAAGKELGNPYFHQPGPLYHMIVIKGYTADGMFITNDPGTRRGADFLYPPDVLLSAMGDWNGTDVDVTQKVIIIAG
ncbi:MAG: C39 family peptidase [bacterium]|nr:C39 family peptidase [bacterium]